MASRDFKGVSELLSPVLAQLAREGTPAALTPVWERVCGPQIARHVRPVGLHQGTLFLEAQTPRWQAELASLEASLLEKLNGALGLGSVARLSIRVAR